MAAIVVTGLILPRSLCAKEPEPTMLFHPVDLRTAELNEKQARILDGIKKAAATVSVDVYRLKPEALSNNNAPLHLALPGNKTLELRNYKIESKPGAKHLQWAAKEKNPSVDLTYNPEEKVATGMIYFGGKVFEVKALGGGLVAVVQTDQAKYVDHPPR
jgi:hypothetical protein